MAVKVELSEFKLNHHHAPFTSSILTDSKYRTQITTGEATTVFTPFAKLAAEPTEIDLVIDVPVGAVINPSNPIAEIFRGHNVFEYKPHNHTATIQDFYKTLGYACFQMVNVDEGVGHPPGSMTFSLVVDRYPRELFNALMQDNSNEGDSAGKGSEVVKREHKGIYHVNGKYPFPAQVIVLKELDSAQFPCMKAISIFAAEDDLRAFLSFARTVNADEPNPYIDIVFRLSYSLHKELYEQIREDPTMHEALMELMKDDVEAIRAKTREETRTETWKEAIMAVATNMLMQHQGLSQIVRATELPEGEVRDLAASLGLAIVS
jgi:hypothetical protein